MKRFRRFLRRLRGFCRRCLRPRCLCVEVDDTTSRSSEEVYQLSGDVLPEPSQHDTDIVTQSVIRREAKAPANPSGAFVHFILPGQCDNIDSQEGLNVPAEPELKLESEALPDTPEDTSTSDLSESEEEQHFLIESEVNSEDEAHPVPPCASPVSELSESEEELHFLIESEVKSEDEALPVPSEGTSHFDFPEAPEEEPAEDFRFCAVLGRGSYGKVLLAEYRQTNIMFAIKAIKKAPMIARQCTERIRYEKEILQTVSIARHPFLVNLYAAFQDEHHIFFALEYAAGGDLFSNMERTGGPFPHDRAVFYAACIVLGLDFLHCNNIVHRDLKLENVVLDMDGFAKITDFGLSKAGIGFGDRTRSIVGTPAYMAPEIVTGQEYTRDVDWWSLGVLIYYMLTGQMPFYDEHLYELYKKIESDKVTYTSDLAPQSTSLISQLLEKDPAQRLGSREERPRDVMAHPFFMGIDWKRLFQRELRPPFLPPLSGPKDVSNFSADFTSMAAVLTPPNGPSLTEEHQDVFRDFNCIAEWML